MVALETMNKTRFLVTGLLLGAVAGGIFFLWERGAAFERADEAHIQAAEKVGADIITETTVSTLNGVRVPFANVYEREDGVTVGSFMLPQGPLEVAQGDTFEVGGRTYFVYDIWCSASKQFCRAAIYEK